mmetsp:Transcript_13744/g.43979  ORF Transcript_13744/g.43979 Transcript_13744/m.43979 type:complete len:246 (+) Transcript_13744:673-1410(+)
MRPLCTRRALLGLLRCLLCSRSRLLGRLQLTRRLGLVLRRAALQRLDLLLRRLRPRLRLRGALPQSVGLPPQVFRFRQGLAQLRGRGSSCSLSLSIHTIVISSFGLCGFRGFRGFRIALLRSGSFRRLEQHRAAGSGAPLARQRRELLHSTMLNGGLHCRAALRRVGSVVAHVQRPVLALLPLRLRFARRRHELELHRLASVHLLQHHMAVPLRVAHLGQLHGAPQVPTAQLRQAPDHFDARNVI